MGAIWFCLVAILVAGYVVLDGFDIGVGILHLWIARNDRERCAVLASIGPVWDGNEVWLLAAGGTLYFAFPALYAAGFSGFYLPLMMVLWLLILRGVSIEFRSHVEDPIWAAFWDVGFCASSILLAVFLGVALGNVVRGVPFDAEGRFFEPLWTTFQPHGYTGILDWFTVPVGILALAALALHGATWLAHKTEAAVHDRALLAASRLWWAVAFLTFAITALSFALSPRLITSFRDHPWGAVFPVLAIAGLTGVFWFARRRRSGRAFICSCAYLLGMLTSVVFSLFPAVLPSSLDATGGLTIANAKAADYGLKIGLAWWIVGMSLAGGYTIFSYRNSAGKVGGASGDAAEKNGI